MSKYAVKGAIREVKNYTKGYTDLQAKVRQATSNDPWGPSGTMMSEIAQATYNHHAFIEIMEMIDKRLNDSGKNWRHVFKALTLLDYCLHSGSENVVSYARENLYIVKTLREFQYIDEDLRDQGANVRQKAKDITALLSDNERLQQERRTRNAMRDRMTGGTGDYPSRRDDYGGDYGTNRYSSEEDRDLQRAIEESKRTAEEHERRMMTRANDEELRAALELSEREKMARERREAEGFFGAPAQPVTYDPFQPLNGTRGQTGGGSDLTGLTFGGEMNQDGFNPYQQQAPQQPTFGAGSSAFGNQMGSMPATNQATNPFGASFGGVPIQNAGSTFGFESSAGFSAASHFSGDGKVDGSSAGLNIARGNAQIDPFASVAGGRDAFGGGSGGTRGANPFGSAELKSPTEQSTAGSAPAQRQANFTSGLPGGSASSGLVNLDSLVPNSSPFHQSSKNPFSSASTGVPGQFDRSAASGGAGAGRSQPPRTLAELAAFDGGSASQSSRSAGTLATGGAGAMTSSFGPHFSSGQPSPPFGYFGQPGQQAPQQPFGGGGAFQRPTAGASGPFRSQNMSPFGSHGGQQQASGSNLLL